jgi:hypothetical protein
MFKLQVHVVGADGVVRAFRQVPKDADRALKAEAKDIANVLKDKIWYGARRLGRQTPRANSTVKVGTEGVWPVISASNTGRAHGLLFGSVFGMKRHTGWYSKPRYSQSTGHQFRPYIGYPGYWFHKEAVESKSWIDSELQDAADEVVRRWAA